MEGGTVLTLEWEDGETTRLPAAALRAACQCAACLGESGTGSWVGDASQVRITDARIVGAYGINLSFAPDDHHTGIFTYETLRSMGQAGE